MALGTKMGNDMMTRRFLLDAGWKPYAGHVVWTKTINNQNYVVCLTPSAEKGDFTFDGWDYSHGEFFDAVMRIALEDSTLTER